MMKENCLSFKIVSNEKNIENIPRFNGIWIPNHIDVDRIKAINIKEYNNVVSQFLIFNFKNIPRIDLYLSLIDEEKVKLNLINELNFEDYGDTLIKFMNSLEADASGKKDYELKVQKVKEIVNDYFVIMDAEKDSKVNLHCFRDFIKGNIINIITEYPEFIDKLPTIFSIFPENFVMNYNEILENLIIYDISRKGKSFQIKIILPPNPEKLNKMLQKRSFSKYTFWIHVKNKFFNSKEICLITDSSKYLLSIQIAKSKGATDEYIQNICNIARKRSFSSIRDYLCINEIFLLLKGNHIDIERRNKNNEKVQFPSDRLLQILSEYDSEEEKINLIESISQVLIKNEVSQEFI